MKKILYIMILSLLFIGTYNNVNAYTCDQEFTGTVRYDATYKFYDTFNAGSKHAYMNNYIVDFINPSYLDKGSSFEFTSELKNSSYKVAKNTSMRIIETGPTNWRIAKHPNKRTNATKESHDFVIIYEIIYDHSNNYPNTADDIRHTECKYYSVSWCGDGIRDSGDEICDPKDTTNKLGWGNGGCNTSCQPINVNPASSCDNITATPNSGNTTLTSTITCSGTNANTYQISCGNGKTINAKTGVCTYTLGGGYKPFCTVNGNITSNSCKTTINVTALTPLIKVEKYSGNSNDVDGNTSNNVNNDTQTVIYGNGSVFNIKVTNAGSEDLKNVLLKDPIAPNCDRTDAQTKLLIKAIGNKDQILNVGETFTYSCDKGNTTANYTNRINVSGDGVNSNQTVTDTDDTAVKLVEPLVQVIKTDANTSDLDGIIGSNDSQTVAINSSAIFSITVTNIGTEDLSTVVLTDTIAPNCNRTDAQTKLLIKAIGNKDQILNVGETFNYVCDKGNTTANYTNSIIVNAIGNTSTKSVNDDDTTVIIVDNVGLSCKATTTGVQSSVISSTTTGLCSNSGETVDSFNSNVSGNTTNYTWNCKDSSGVIHTGGNCNASYTAIITPPAVCEATTTGVQSSVISSTTTGLCSNSGETVDSFNSNVSGNTTNYTWNCKDTSGVIHTGGNCNASYTSGGGSGSSAQCYNIEKDNNEYTCTVSSAVETVAIDCNSDGKINFSKASTRNTSNGRYEAVFTCDPTTNADGSTTTPTPRCGVTRATAWNIGESIGIISPACKINTTKVCGDGKIDNPNDAGVKEECEKIDTNNDGSVDIFPSNCSSTCKLKAKNNSFTPNCSNSFKYYNANKYECDLINTVPSGGEVKITTVSNFAIGDGQNIFKFNNNNRYSFNSEQYSNEYLQLKNIGDESILLEDDVLCIMDRGSNKNIVVGDGVNNIICDTQKISWLFPGEIKYFRAELLNNIKGEIDGLTSGNTSETTKLVLTIKDSFGTYEWSPILAGEMFITVAKPTIISQGGGTTYVADTNNISNVNKIAKEVSNRGNGTTINTNQSNFTATVLGNSNDLSNIETVTEIGSAYNEATELENNASEIVQDSTNSRTPGDINSFGSYRGMNNVKFVKDTNITLGSQSFTDNITYIIENGNLIIDQNIESNKNIAFIVKNGNIIVKNNVSKIDGTYVNIGGEIKGDTTTSEQLIINGSMYGDLNNLISKRTHISMDIGGNINTGTQLQFSSNIFNKPAPLVGQFIKEYIDSQKIAK